MKNNLEEAMSIADRDNVATIIAGVYGGALAGEKRPNDEVTYEIAKQAIKQYFNNVEGEEDDKNDCHDDEESDYWHNLIPYYDASQAYCYLYERDEESFEEHGDHNLPWRSVPEIGTGNFRNWPHFLSYLNQHSKNKIFLGCFSEDQGTPVDVAEECVAKRMFEIGNWLVDNNDPECAGAVYEYYFEDNEWWYKLRTPNWEICDVCQSSVERKSRFKIGDSAYHKSNLLVRIAQVFWDTTELDYVYHTETSQAAHIKESDLFNPAYFDREDEVLIVDRHDEGIHEIKGMDFIPEGLGVWVYRLETDDSSKSHRCSEGNLEYAT